MMQLAILTTTVLIIQNQSLQTTLPGAAISNKLLILPVFTLMPPRDLLMEENFGFGAEIGISTQKLHARGPMGLQQLTTIKYEITGNGQIRK